MQFEHRDSMLSVCLSKRGLGYGHDASGGIGAKSAMMILWALAKANRDKPVRVPMAAAASRTHACMRV